MIDKNTHTLYSVKCVERGSSVGRMPDSQSREPGFESPLLQFRSFTSRRLSRLSCINEYLAIDSGGNVSEWSLRNRGPASCVVPVLVTV